MKRSNYVAFLPFYLLVTVIAIGIAAMGSDAVTAFHQGAPVARQHCIIIDAGHGGIDGGATSCTGVLESHLNLEIALKLEPLLQFLGYDTKMIRTTDISIYTQGNTIAAQKVSDLKERVRIANETENAIYISLHQNTYPDSRYGGPQVFYGNPESRQLAQNLQTNLNRAVGSNRKSKKATGVYLMEHLECTGVLLECGFLSNPTEEAKLRDNTYQLQLCAIIASTLSSFTK